MSIQKTTSHSQNACRQTVLNSGEELAVLSSALLALETHPKPPKVTQANHEAYVAQYQLPASKTKMAFCCQVHRTLPT